MRNLKLLISVYLAVMTGWVIVHFSQHTFFEEESAGSHPEDGDRLFALDVCMAVAFLLTAVTAYQAARKAGKQSPPGSGWMYSNLFFYFTILVAIPFYANWFAAQGHTDDGLLWIYVETLGPLTWGTQGVRLWRGARTPDRATV